jgi:hypothetical protein
MITYTNIRNGYFGVITLFGILILLRVATMIWRTHDNWDRFDLAILAFGITTVWACCLRQRRAFDQLQGHLGNDVLVRLSGNSVYLALMAYLLISVALHFGR